MKIYKMPFLSRLAWFVQNLLPDRVHAWIWIAAYDSLDKHMRGVTHVEEDGFALFDAVSAIRLENVKRQIIRDHLRGVLKEKDDE